VTRRRLVITVAVAVAALVIAVSFKSRDLPSSAVEIQIHERKSLEVAGEHREYCLIVPRSQSGDLVPLVIAFHGIGEPAAAMVDYARLDQLAAEHGALVALPEMSRGAWTARGPDALSPQNPDVLFFDALAGRLAERYPVDARRVYVLGMSNGASFAQLLMHLRSSTIAGVVAHSGPPPRELTNVVPERPCPILLLVGTDDSPFVVDDVRGAARTYRASGHVVELIAVDGLGHAWSREHDGAIWEFLTRHRLAE
jgi:poly(3-hydroxybutyrate) depolymerase